VNLSNSGDQVIVLDLADTVLDVFEYEDNDWPTVTSFPSIATDHSAERVPTGRDRDRCEIDFVDRGTASPDSLPTDRGNGEGCANPGECGSGYCQDGVCCSTPCDVDCDICDALGVCGIAAVTDPCQDGDDCTAGDHCSGTDTTCVSGTTYDCTPMLCEVSSVCDGTGGCTITYTAADTPCNDNDPCTYGTLCDGAGTCDGTAYTCTPGPCEETSTCDGSGLCDVTFRAADTPCDDGDPCTYGTLCDGAGTCDGTAYTCTAGVCEDTSLCDGTGGCIVTNSPSGRSCDDGDPCTEQTQCDGNGNCTGGTNVCGDGGPPPDAFVQQDGAPGPDAGDEFTAKGRGGCNCRAAPAQTVPFPGFMILIFFGLVWSWSHRRRRKK
jgi:hypothetical protein